MIPCNSGRTHLAAQTLFLGASIADFSTNMGWGGRSSQLTVKLVEDGASACNFGPQFKPYSYSDNHFYDCETDEDCFVDEKGLPYREQDKPNQPKSKEKIVPGKVYYVWTPERGFISRYWFDSDPGFFGTKTSFDHTGIYNRNFISSSTGFDIINTPVIFKIGSFSFTGLVQSWERSYDTGGENYSVTIDSLDSILDQCYVVLDKYAGSVFAKLPANFYGGPTNYTGPVATYQGSIKSGNIPNVFNVYGFLESMAIGDFGGSNRNDNGISASLIIDALSVLTSSVSPNLDPAGALDLLNKRAFSPFGRIIVKVPQTNQTYLRATPNFTNVWGMGFLPITYDGMGIERCHFALDLSELPRPPLDFRIQEPAISILSLVQQITTATGCDFYFDTIPATLNGIPYNVLKVKVIRRSAQPDPRQIEKTIAAFERNGYAISSSRAGKEKNTNTARVMYIGAPQQRLYQAKSYRLAFSQSNYIYDIFTKTFVNYYNPGNNALAGEPGKFRSPSSLSTRNTAIVNSATNKYSQLFNIDEDIRGIVSGGSQFNSVDSTWADAKLSGSTRVGNYASTIGITRPDTERTATLTNTANRFFPLYRDLISPFLGYKNEENFQVNTNAGESNVYRRIRPVWMDGWTGQIIVLLDVSELPKTLSINLSSLYPGSTMFTVTESELRASDNLDSYITYCMGKIFKPDLYLMLQRAYIASGKVIFQTNGSTVNPDQGNAAGQTGEPTVAQPQSDNIVTVNYTLLLSQDFLRDFENLRKFINNISQNYGTKYLVSLPEVISYKDQQYANVQVPASLTTTNTGDTVQVYQGSGKIFHSYEIATDGAWEEFGNIIDDSIVIGSPDWYRLSDENGKIKPLLGYNASDSIDHIARSLCSQAANFSLANMGFEHYYLLDLRQSIVSRSTDCDDPMSFRYPSINVSSLSPENFVLKGAQVANSDAFGVGNSPVSRRMYLSCSVEKDFAFGDPVNLRLPYAIVNTQAVELTSSSKLFANDPNLTVNSTAAMEDLTIYLHINNTNYDVDDDVFVRTLLFKITSLGLDRRFLNLASINETTNHITLRPKVAHPYFAAVPLKSNTHCYGPWTNYPHLDGNTVFPDAVSDGHVDNALENLIAGVKVEVKSDYAPWNYGGMSFLDEAALYEIYNEVQYQQVLESATINIPGLPIFGIGGSFAYNTPPAPGQLAYNNQIYTVTVSNLLYSDRLLTPSTLASLPISVTPTYDLGLSSPNIVDRPLSYQVISLLSPPSPAGPIISSINCNISPQSVGTSYSFRTYTQKLGFFNKENTDRIKSAGLNTIKNNKQISSLIGSFISKVNKDFFEITRDRQRRNFTVDQFQSQFFGKSPGNVLIGMARPFIAPPFNVKQVIEDSQLNKPKQTIVPAIKYGIDPGDSIPNQLFSEKPILALSKDLRMTNYVGNFTDREAMAELKGYNLKSFMSWDGIFSPISFYPNTYLSTYGLLKYTRKTCPECKGTGVKTYEVYDYKNKQKQNIEYSCVYCSIKKVNIGSSVTTSAATSESLPPYIITNNNDINTILEFNPGSSNIGSGGQSGDSSKAAGVRIPVNAITLQPIVVPYGEFKNLNAQTNDRCRHCIAIVGRGRVPQQGQISPNINRNIKTFVDPTTGQIVPNNVNGAGVNVDYYPYDLLAKFDRSNTARDDYVMNQRFMGLRGPIMLHGWGYDIEGYPVPNASDEPAIEDNFGRVARFFLKIEPQGASTFGRLQNGDTFIVGTDPIEPPYVDFVYYTKSIGMQIMNPEDDQWQTATDNLAVTKVKVSNDLDTTPAPSNIGAEAYKNAGDIITKQYEHNGSKWVKKARSNQFALNWAERPDLWPVGPVDLRWDDSRRVWTINSSSSPYKFVYVTLEEDLVKDSNFDETYPARGFLDDIEYSKEPLPNGYRRLVYVKDKTGYTAPRGVKLLCRYDTDSGFYEPISKPSIVAQGNIDANSMARIEMDYAQGNRSLTSPVLLTSFSNPLGLNATQGNRGMFTYTRGQWILTAAR